MHKTKPLNPEGMPVLHSLSDPQDVQAGVVAQTEAARALLARTCGRDHMVLWHALRLFSPIH